MINRKGSRSTGNKRKPKKKVLIALEDTKSARLYFKKLVKDKGLSGDIAFADHCGTDPNNVVQAIINDSKAKNTTYERMWAVIDVDSYKKSQVNGAIQRAKELDICIAVSNECYELWILLHFIPISAHHDRVELNKKLDFHFLKNFKKEYSKSSEDVYELIIGKQKEALSNAKKLMISHLQDKGRISPYDENPLTTIYQLVEYLNALRDSPNNLHCECFPKDCDNI